MAAVAANEQAAIHESALSYLARREHCQQELVDKLQRKYDNNEAILQTVSRLQDVGLLSDERYTEQFVRHKTQSGKGPYLIGQMLRSNGIAADLIEQHLETSREYWLPYAQDVYDRKYRGSPVNDYKERAKRQRFLMSRGFSSDVVNAVIGT